MALFETSVELDATPQEVYDFLARPSNVERITPGSLGLKFVDPPEVITLGLILNSRSQGWGQILHSQHEICELEPPAKITERQVKGPFQAWRHEHLIEALPTGVTLLADRIEFEPPGGLLGFLVTANKILDQLEEAYDHRHRMLKRYLSGAEK